MTTLVTLWNQATERRFRSALIGLGVILSGVVLIAIGAVVEWGWTRLIGAGAISLASVFVGALVGWSDPVRPRIAAVFSSWSRILLALLAFVMMAPLFIGLLALFGGLFVALDDTSWLSLFAGTVITLFLLIITLLTVALALPLAFRGLRKSSAEVPSDSNGQDES
ncbi:MAG: hypothetical protein WD401_02155 [Thermomicrobiaceae bacterium]